MMANDREKEFSEGTSLPPKTGEIKDVPDF
jgi:hypothetical protein